MAGPDAPCTNHQAAWVGSGLSSRRLVGVSVRPIEAIRGVSRAFSETDGRIVRRERTAGSMKYLTGGAVRTLTTSDERPKSDNPPNTVRRLSAAGSGSTSCSLLSRRGFVGFDYPMERPQARTWALDPASQGPVCGMPMNALRRLE
jgi:hypothetical protein